MKVINVPPLSDQTEAIENAGFKGVPTDFVYVQEEDCCGRVDVANQELNVLIEDGGGGSYIVFKTLATNWTLCFLAISKKRLRFFLL